MTKQQLRVAFLKAICPGKYMVALEALIDKRNLKWEHLHEAEYGLDEIVHIPKHISYLGFIRIHDHVHDLSNGKLFRYDYVNARGDKFEVYRQTSAINVIVPVLNNNIATFDEGIGPELLDIGQLTIGPGKVEIRGPVEASLPDESKFHDEKYLKFAKTQLGVIDNKDDIWLNEQNK